MRVLNRSAIVVRPRPPFLDWLHVVDPTSATFTLTNLTREPTIYLVDECDDSDNERAYLQAVHAAIFEDQLGGCGAIGPHGRRPGPSSSGTGLISFDADRPRG
jgi:hypothetical protein